MDDLIVSGLRIDWNMLTDSYVSRIPSLRSIDELEFHKNVTFLVGENGSGKSTLLEGIAVACGFNAHGSADGIRRPLDTQCPFLFPENPLGIWEDLNTLNIFHHRIWSFADSARSAGCGNPVIRRKRRPSLRL